MVPNAHEAPVPGQMNYASDERHGAVRERFRSDVDIVNQDPDFLAEKHRASEKLREDLRMQVEEKARRKAAEQAHVQREEQAEEER